MSVGARVDIWSAGADGEYPASPAHPLPPTARAHPCAAPSEFNASAYQHRRGRRDTVDSTDQFAAMVKARVAFCDIREAADHDAATLVLGTDRNGSTPLCSLNLRWNDPNNGTTTA